MHARSTTRHAVDVNRSSQPTSAITPRFLMNVFVTWWKVAIPLAVVIAAVGATVVIARFKPEYRASALISISQPPHIAFRDADISSNSFVATQLELLRTAVVLAPVLADPEISRLPELENRPDPLALLVKTLSVSRIGQSELYNVSFVSQSPTGAAAVCTKVIQEYMTQYVGYSNVRYDAMLKHLKEQRNLREQELVQRRRKMLQLNKERTGKDPWNGQVADGALLAESPLNELHSELSDVGVQLALLQAEIESHKDAALVSANGEGEADLMALRVLSNPAVRKKRAEIEAIERQIEQSDHITGPDHPRRVLLASSLANRQQELEELEAAAAIEIGNKVRLERDQEVKSLKQDYARLKLRETQLRERFDEQIADLQDGSEKALSFTFLQGDLQRAQRVFDLISERELALRVERHRPERVRLVQPARVPVTPISSFPIKELGICLIAAVGLPFGGVALYEFIRKKVYSAEQLKSELHVPMMGEVARLPRTLARSSDGLLESDEFRMYSESVDILQTNLLLSQAFRPSTALGVTSSISGEGKTSVSIQLARSVARSTGQPTLLIETDLRSPDVCELLRLSDSPGLIEFLAGECSVEAAIQDTGFHSLSAICAGRFRRHATGLAPEPEIRGVAPVGASRVYLRCC